MNFFPGEDPENGDDGVADSSSVSLDYETDLLYVAVAHDEDIDGAGVKTSRLIGGYTFGPVRVMLLYQQTDADVVDEDGFGASLAWTFGKNIAKFQYLTADIWAKILRPIRSRTLRVAAFSGARSRTGRGNQAVRVLHDGRYRWHRREQQYFAIGIEHNF